MTHRDIDFHIYSSPLRLADSFAAMARLAENSRIRSITFNNYTLKIEGATASTRIKFTSDAASGEFRCV